MNTQDVEKYMVGLGFKHPLTHLSHGTEIKDLWYREDLLPTVDSDTAAFMYQQTLLARKDEQRITAEIMNVPGATVSPRSAAQRMQAGLEDRLAELNQLLERKSDE